MREPRRMRSCEVSGGGRGSEESGGWEGGVGSSRERWRLRGCSSVPVHCC